MYSFLKKSVGMASLIWLVAAFAISAASAPTASKSLFGEDNKIAMTEKSKRITHVAEQQWLRSEAQERAALKARLVTDMKSRIEFKAPAAHVE